MMVEWNALVIDDAVVVHIDDAASGGSTCGTVNSIQQHRDGNDVAIVLADSAEGSGPTLHPTRFQVHADSATARAVCPWCAAPAKGAPKQKQQQWVT
jgi:hypothetical protein